MQWRVYLRNEGIVQHADLLSGKTKSLLMVHLTNDILAIFNIIIKELYKMIFSQQTI